MHSEISFLLTFPNPRSGRARLSHRHTSSCSLVRRQQKPTHRRVTLCFFLTGPHTFTAISSPTQAPSASLSGGARTQVNDAVKASVPKLFSCPGASASSPSREFSAERRFSATQKTYNTVGSRLLRRKPARFGIVPLARSPKTYHLLPPSGKDPYRARQRIKPKPLRPGI